MDIIKKNVVKSSGSNFSLSSSFNAVRMHDLKESSEENLSENTSETSSISKADGIHLENNIVEDKTKVPLRRASSDLSRNSWAGTTETSSTKSTLENRLSSDLPKLNAKLQTLANDTKQFLRRRTHRVPKKQTPYDDADKKITSDKEQSPVEVAQVAAVFDALEKAATIEPFPSSALRAEIAEEGKEESPAPVNPSESDAPHAKSNTSRKFSIFNYWRQICGLLLVVLSVLTFYKDFSSFLCGLLWGVYLSALVFRFIFWLYIPSDDEVDHRWAEQASTTAVTEEELMKVDKVVYKGWMNLLKGRYDPTRFRVNATNTVLVRLDREVLRLSIPKTNILKHTFWNEVKVEPTFLRQELYNIAGAVVSVRPKGLARRRWWSRKYPICIAFAHGAVVGLTSDSQSDTGLVVSQHDQQPISGDESDFESVNDFRCYNTDSDSDTNGLIKDEISSDEEEELKNPKKRDSKLSAPHSVVGLPMQVEMEIEGQQPKNRKTIFLFARSSREKEQWFHQLCKAAGQHSFKLERAERGAISDSEIDKIELRQQALDWILYTSVQKQFHMSMEAILPGQIEPKGVVSMDLGVQMWKPTNRVTAEISANKDNITWANALATRVFLDFSKDPNWVQKVKDKIDRKLATIHLPYFIEALKLANLEMGVNTPRITGVYEPNVNEWGLWVDVNIEYSGGIHLVLETKLNLMKLKKDVGQNAIRNSEALTRYSDEDMPESPESSDGEDDKPILPFSKKADKQQESTKESTGKKILHFIDKVTQSKHFQDATENKYVKKLMKGVSETSLILMVDVVYVEGTLALNIPTPPSDRIWYGFRCPPKIVLKARPKVGDRSLNLSHITDWIENKLCFLLEKFLVIPNMDDTIIPLMSGSPLFKNVNK